MLAQPWQTEASPNNPFLWAVNNPHSVPYPHREDYFQVLEWSNGRLLMDVNVPEELFNPGAVLAYPQVFEGIKDVTLPHLVGGQLPVQVSDIESFNTTFAYHLMAGSLTHANVAAEIFVHNTGTDPRNLQGPEDTRLYELMFWAQKPSDPQIGLGQVVMDAEKFTVHVKPGNRGYIAFIMKVPPNAGDPVSIQWDSLIDITNAIADETGLIDRVPPNGYVTAAEIGVEVWSGAFQLALSRIENSVIRKEPGVGAPTNESAVQLAANVSQLAQCLQTLVSMDAINKLGPAKPAIKAICDEINVTTEELKNVE